MLTREQKDKLIALKLITGDESPEDVAKLLEAVPAARDAISTEKSAEQIAQIQQQLADFKALSDTLDADDDDKTESEEEQSGENEDSPDATQDADKMLLAIRTAQPIRKPPTVTKMILPLLTNQRRRNKNQTERNSRIYCKRR